MLTGVGLRVRNVPRDTGQVGRNMLVMVGTKDCRDCRTLRKRLAVLGLDYLYLDAYALKAGHYGVSEMPDDPRVAAFVGLLRQNLEVPLLLLDGDVQDISIWLGARRMCMEAACRVA